MMFGVNDSIGGAGQGMRWADGLDAIVANINGGIAQLIASIVQCGNGVSVVNKQGGHDHDFA
jgi:type IV secretory pathway VirB2 component (pilin)